MFWKMSICFSSPLFIFHVSHPYSSTGFTNVFYSKIFIFLRISFALHISFSRMNVFLAFPILKKLTILYLMSPVPPPTFDTVTLTYMNLATF